jgi:hypothetical protein
VTTLTTPLDTYLLSEGSGTTAGDSESSPLDLAFTGSPTWTTLGGGNAIAYGGGTGKYARVTISSTKVTTAINGGKTWTMAVVSSWDGTNGNTAYAMGSGDGSFGTLHGPHGHNGNIDFWVTTAADSLVFAGSVARTSGDIDVWFAVEDTASASARSTLYKNGFAGLATTSGVTQNTTISLSGSGLVLGLGDPCQGGDPLHDTQAYAALWSQALGAPEVLALTVRLAADNDHSPSTATGPLLLSASTNGGTDDASTASTDHTVAPTVNVASSGGNNRKVIACVSYSGVSTGITTKTLGGVAFSTALDTGPDGSGRGVAILYMDDADIPGTGTQTASFVVDGASGTVAATLAYLEGAAQGAPGNTVNTSGTGTSLTGTPGSNDGAGSIRFDALFDATTSDTPVSGSGQLKLVGAGSKLNGTTTGNTHTLATSAKYNRVSASNPTSWSSLTNTSQKYLISIEVAAASSFTPGSFGWHPSEYRTPPRPPPPRVEPQFSPAPFFFFGSYGWHSADYRRSAQPRPATVVPYAPPLASLAFSFGSYGWHSAEYRVPPKPPPPRYESSFSPTPFFFFGSYGWHSAEYRKAPQPRPPTFLPAAPPLASIAFVFGSYGWHSADYRTPPKPPPPRFEAHFLPTPFFFFGSYGWHSANYRKTPEPNPPTVFPVEPVGSRFLSPFGWHFVTTRPAQPQPLSRPVPTDPVGARLVFTPGGGPIWYIPQYHLPGRGRTARPLPDVPLSPFIGVAVYVDAPDDRYAWAPPDIRSLPADGWLVAEEPDYFVVPPEERKFTA